MTSSPRLMCLLVVAGLSWVPFARALDGGQPDAGNVFSNVGARFGVDSSGTRFGLCSGILVHERLFLTAGHCAGPVPAGLRGYVTFSSFDGRNPSTWHEVIDGFAHPSMGTSGFVRNLTGGVSDVGLLVFAKPVRGIQPALLPKPNAFNEIYSGAQMTVVGYGCGPASAWDGIRDFGTYTLSDVVNVEWARFLKAPSGLICPGDSGGPTFHEGRVVAVTSDADAVHAYQARMDAPAVLDWIASVMALYPPVVEANYQGLWWNAAESGWGINLAHQGDQIYLTWYTYDATGKALWLAMLASKTASGAYSGDILELRGPPFSAVPFAPGPTASTVGNGTLTFTGASSGTFAYTAKGVSQSKPITRFVFGPQPVCGYAAAPGFAAATNYQDLWWNPAESGWGINLTHQGDQIYATWYTYDSDGSPLWLASLLSRSGATYSGALLRFTGPPFSAVPFPLTAAPTSVGTATLSFTNGNAGTWSYSVGATSATKPMSRFLFAAPAGTICQ